MDFPATIPVAKINGKHAEWLASHIYWDRLRKLNKGGQLIQQFAEEFLHQRAMEPGDVYANRIANFSYTNHLANILGWYGSALFKQAPSIGLRDSESDTQIPEGDQREKQLNQFVDNCDGKGTKLSDFWQKAVTPNCLLYKKSYILFDLPVAPEFRSKAEQDAAGALVPHLVAYAPQDLINWQVDENDEFQWAIIKLRATTQDSPFDKVQVADRWYIYTRDQVAAYEFIFPEKDTSEQNQIFSEKDYGENVPARLLDGYPRPHSLADEGIVPIFKETIHEDHWIGDRIALPLEKLLNLENAHDWSLEQANLAQLVIYSASQIDTVSRGEAHFLQLGQGDKAEYLEPSGRTIKASQDRINELREDVYRLANLVAQGRSSSASAAMQSGYSKEQDMLPARDKLAGLGDQTRGAMEHILQTVAKRMSLPVTVNIQGFNFGDRSDVVDLEVFEKADGIMEINSPTAERETAKRILRIKFPDASRELLAKMDQEIDENPTPTEAQQQQQEQAVSQRLAQQAKLSSPRLFEDAVQAA